MIVCPSARMFDFIAGGESPANEAAGFSRQNYRDFPLGSPPQAADIVGAGWKVHMTDSVTRKASS